MACPQCSSHEVVRFAFFESPRACCMCCACGFSCVEDDPMPAEGGDGRTGDGCMDDVQVEPYCSQALGPSRSPSAAGNSNRIVGLLRDPHKGVM